MIKYVCDICGKPLLEEDDVRYVVKIEVYSAYESSDADDYDEADAVEEILGGPEDPEQADDDGFVSFRFDLCPDCHKRYLEDPLFKKTHRRIGFSDN